jgi:hypothetical protein
MVCLCIACENLGVAGLNNCFLPDLENSSNNGCDGCSLLFNAVQTCLEIRHPSLAVSGPWGNSLTVRWQVSPREIFKLEIVDTHRYKSSPSRQEL